MKHSALRKFAAAAVLAVSFTGLFMVSASAAEPAPAPAVKVTAGHDQLDSSLKFHIMKAKENGVTKEEMAEILTQTAFYAGWPKAWAAFRYAKEVYEG